MADHHHHQQQQQHSGKANDQSPNENSSCGSSSDLPCLILECRRQRLSTPQDAPQSGVGTRKHAIRVFTFCPTLLCRGATAAAATRATASSAGSQKSAAISAENTAGNAGAAAAANCFAKQVKLIIVCHCGQPHENTFAYPEDRQSLGLSSDWSQICQALNTGCQQPGESGSSSQEPAGNSANKEAISAAAAASSSPRLSTLPHQSLFNIPQRSIRLKDAWNQAVTEGMHSGKSPQQHYQKEQPSRLSIQARRSQFDSSSKTPLNGFQNSSAGQDSQPSTSSQTGSPQLLEAAECPTDLEHHYRSMPQLVLSNGQLQLRRIADFEEEATLATRHKPLINQETREVLNGHATNSSLPPTPLPTPPPPSPPSPLLPLLPPPPPPPAAWGVHEISDSTSRGRSQSDEQPSHPLIIGAPTDMIHRRLTGPPRDWIRKKRTSEDSRDSDMLTEIGSADSASHIVSVNTDAPLESVKKLSVGPVRPLQSTIVEAEAAVAAAEAALVDRDDFEVALCPRRLPVDSMVGARPTKRDNIVQLEFLQQQPQQPQQPQQQKQQPQQQKEQPSVVYQQYPLSRIYEINPARIESAEEVTQVGSTELLETEAASRSMVSGISALSGSLSLLSQRSHSGLQSDASISPSMITHGRSIIGSMNPESELRDRSESIRVRVGSVESLDSTMRSHMFSDVMLADLQGQQRHSQVQTQTKPPHQPQPPPAPHHNPPQHYSQRANDSFPESRSTKVSLVDSHITDLTNVADRPNIAGCQFQQPYQQRPHQHHDHEECDHHHQESMVECCIQPMIPVLLMHQRVRGPACCHGQTALAMQGSAELVSIAFPPRIRRCPRASQPVDCMESTCQPFRSRSGGSETCSVCRQHSRQQNQQQNSVGSHHWNQQNQHRQGHQPPATVSASPELPGAAEPRTPPYQRSGGGNNSQRNSARLPPSSHLAEYLNRVLSWDCSHPSAVIRSWRASGSPSSARSRRSTSSIAASCHRSVPGWCSEAAIHQIVAPAESLVAFNSDADSSAPQQQQQVLGDPPTAGQPQKS